ncbi:S1 family peptidase [Streptomyces sp. PA03-6a]|nr:S1 family peptidase [Streptomyces sp. PA03-6a]
MKHRRISGRKAVLAGSGAAAVLAALIVLPQANAAPSPAPAPKSLTPAAAVTLAAHLTSQLGTKDTAGSYYDAGSDRLIVNVLDAAAADTVRAAGAVPKTVANTMAELRSATRTLGLEARIPGTAWSVDPRTNQVVVTADRTVSAAGMARLGKAVDGLGAGTARIHKSKGEFTPFIAGGDAIFGSGARCSLGFNVVKDGQPYFLTAGHCGVDIKSWSDSSGGQEIGSAATFPGHDYALVKYTGTGVDHPSAVDLYNGSTQEITSAATPTVGQAVRRSGSTTQVHDGTVTGLDATVNYQEGSVSGLIQTDVCAEPGDSGGALFSGSTALGLTSGGSGDCTGGGETFFQPVTDALEVYGAEIG